MKPIQREKKLQVMSLYLLSFPYEEIVRTTGLSKGSVVAIIKEARAGALKVPGTTSDQFNDLRRLASELRTKGLDPSQAALGVLFFDRFQSLGVALEDIDRWANLVKDFRLDDITAERFYEAAMRLWELEEREGKPFEEIVSEYEEFSKKNTRLNEEVGLLEGRREELKLEVGNLGSDIKALKQEKKRLEDEKDALSSHVAHYAEIRDEVQELESKKITLEAEIGVKGEEVNRLKTIGFAEKHLSRLRSVLEKIGEKEGLSGEATNRKFFDSVDIFGDILEFENQRKAMKSELSSLHGEISTLKETKAGLEGAIKEAASTGSRVIAQAADQIRSQMAKAGSQLTKEIKSASKEVDTLFKVILNAGVEVGQMTEMAAKGDESREQLQKIIEDAKKRIGET